MPYYIIDVCGKHLLHQFIQYVPGLFRDLLCFLVDTSMTFHSLKNHMKHLGKSCFGGAYVDSVFAGYVDVKSRSEGFQ